MPPPPSGDDARRPQGSYSATSAIGYGWRGTTSNLGAMVGVTVVVILSLIVVSIVVSLVSSPSAAEVDDALNNGGLADLVAASAPPWWVTVLSQVITMVLLIPLVRASLAVVDGGQVRFADAFDGDQLGQVVIVAVILGLASGIANNLPVLGILLSIAIGFLTAYTIYFVLAERLDAIEALQASARFAIRNAGPVILLFLLSIGVGILGLLACLVGFFVAMPVVYVAQAYTFRHLRGDAIAPR